MEDFSLVNSHNLLENPLLELWEEWQKEKRRIMRKLPSVCCAAAFHPVRACRFFNQRLRSQDFTLPLMNST